MNHPGMDHSISSFVNTYVNEAEELEVEASKRELYESLSQIGLPEERGQDERSRASKRDPPGHMADDILSVHRPRSDHGSVSSRRSQVSRAKQKSLSQSDHYSTMSRKPSRRSRHVRTPRAVNARSKKINAVLQSTWHELFENESILESNESIEGTQTNTSLEDESESNHSFAMETITEAARPISRKPKSKTAKPLRATEGYSWNAASTLRSPEKAWMKLTGPESTATPRARTPSRRSQRTDLSEREEDPEFLSPRSHTTNPRARTPSRRSQRTELSEREEDPEFVSPRSKTTNPRARTPSRRSQRTDLSEREEDPEFVSPKSTKTDVQKVHFSPIIRTRTPSATKGRPVRSRSVERERERSNRSTRSARSVGLPTIDLESSKSSLRSNLSGVSNGVRKRSPRKQSQVPESPRQMKPKVQSPSHYSRRPQHITTEQLRQKSSQPSSPKRTPKRKVMRRSSLARSTGPTGTEKFRAPLQRSSSACEVSRDSVMALLSPRCPVGQNRRCSSVERRRVQTPVRNSIKLFDSAIVSPRQKNGQEERSISIEDLFLDPLDGSSSALQRSHKSSAVSIGSTRRRNASPSKKERQRRKTSKSSTASIDSPKRKTNATKSQIHLLEEREGPRDAPHQEALIHEPVPSHSSLQEFHFQMENDKRTETYPVARSSRFRSASAGRAGTPSRRHGAAYRAAMRTSSVAARRSITPNRRHNSYVSLADSVSMRKERR